MLQAHWAGHPATMFIGELLDCPKHFFMMCAPTVGTGLGPAKLPDISVSLATNSLHKSMLHFRLLPAIAEHCNLQGSAIQEWIQSSELLCRCYVSTELRRPESIEMFT